MNTIKEYTVQQFVNKNSKNSISRTFSATDLLSSSYSLGNLIGPKCAVASSQPGTRNLRCSPATLSHTGGTEPQPSARACQWRESASDRDGSVTCLALSSCLISSHHTCHSHSLICSQYLLPFGNQRHCNIISWMASFSWSLLSTCCFGISEVVVLVLDTYDSTETTVN